MKLGSEEDIRKIATYVANKAASLVERVLGEKLPILYVTIFAKTPHEFERFVEWASVIGSKSEANNGYRFSLKEPIQTTAGQVKHLRIRYPDIYRSQLGCADFEVSDYKTFKSEKLAKHPDNLRLIERPEYEMLEFYEYVPNEVLAYIVSK